MSIVQIRMKDRVFARMLEIVLLENKVLSQLTDKKEAKIPEDCSLIITEPACADKEVNRFEKTVFICKGNETPPEDKVTFKRPFLIDTFLSEVLEMLFSEEKTVSAAPSLSLDKKRKAVRLGKTSVSLTEKEFRLLLLLYENKGSTVTNEEITKRVWDSKTTENSNVSAVYVNYLRKKLDEKLGKRLIYSVRGKGYMLKI